jgi:3'-phosphoadenosine 5'-phosphosulfate sulfotransferase (PAPS reductase)/FAD synthetase
VSGDDPFRIAGPAIVSFSGGRSSATMLYRIVQAHGGTLPADVHVAFCNTGKEMPATLDFVQLCGERWGVDIVWLEYRRAEAPQDRWRRVDHATASRNGEPFDALLDMKQFLPNPVARFCTQELKINAIGRWAAAQGFDEVDRVIGLRYDEPRRVARLRGQRDCRFPLYDGRMTKRDVAAFWRAQNFDLGLPGVNGVTPAGNCDLCFLKSAATIQRIMRNDPGAAQWWIAAESAPRASNHEGGRFRSDRPSYAAMLDAVERQAEFVFPGDADLADCICGDDGAAA